jgi:hypothetical protein
MIFLFGLVIVVVLKVQAKIGDPRAFFRCEATNPQARRLRGVCIGLVAVILLGGRRIVIVGVSTIFRSRFIYI